jgi:hypothetical protein
MAAIRSGLVKVSLKFPADSVSSLCVYSSSFGYIKLFICFYSNSKFGVVWYAVKIESVLRKNVKFLTCVLL